MKAYRHISRWNYFCRFAQFVEDILNYAAELLQVEYFHYGGFDLNFDLDPAKVNLSQMLNKHAKFHKNRTSIHSRQVDMLTN